MSSNESREFDVIIFGASGFTGLFVVRELLLSIDACPAEYGSLRWAVAGRNESKIADTLARVGAELDKDLSGVAIVVADVAEEESLRAMARRTRVLVNVVGPYRFFGRPVVSACVHCHTHHVDISGEPQYIEQMQLDYHAQAVDSGILLVSTCGWDSIPCDLGVDFLKRNFNGKVHSVETYVKNTKGPSGYVVNFGTFESAIYGFAHMKELGPIRRRLYKEVLPAKMPRSSRRLDKKIMPFREDGVEGWNVEFPGSDRSVVNRTQAYNYQHFGEQPLQIQTYYTVGSFAQLVGLLVFASMFALLAKCKFGQNLLTSHPELFTFGVFSKKGPSRQQIDEAKFELLVKGKGWASESGENEPSRDFDKKMSVRVSGPDAGYMATSACIVQAALTILKDRDQMPSGVLTPASAFRNTKLLDRLQSRNVKFEVISQSQ